MFRLARSLRCQWSSLGAPWRSLRHHLQTRPGMAPPTTGQAPHATSPSRRPARRDQGTHCDGRHWNAGPPGQGLSRQWQPARIARDDDGPRWPVRVHRARGRPVSVSASKGIYVTFEYGQRKPFERAKPIDLAEGQVAEKTDIALPRGGVISGVLLDDVGDPAAGVRVTAMRQQYRDGKRGLVSIGRSVETNDVGQYRLYGLPPGGYFVGALPSTVNPAIPMLNAPSGAPTYFPGTVSEMEAQRVTVQPAQERALADFTLVPSRLVKVSGTATNATGRPVQMVMLVPSPRCRRATHARDGDGYREA